MRGNEQPNWTELYYSLAILMKAFESAGLCPPMKLIIESDRELERFKQVFLPRSIPPQMEEVDGGVWFGNFEVRVTDD